MSAEWTTAEKLRDYFAAQALPHALALVNKYGDRSAEDHILRAAAEAYRIADAMMRVRAPSSNSTGRE